MTRIYKWTEAYRAALLETDSSKMQERIEVAERALQRREIEMAEDHGGTSEERQAIEDARRALKILSMDVARWSEKSSKK